MLRRKFAGTPGKPGLSTVMVDAFNVMQDRITRARLAGDPPDVLISPRSGEVGLFDFHRAQEAIELGAQATERRSKASTSIARAGLVRSAARREVDNWPDSPCALTPSRMYSLQRARASRSISSTRNLTTSPIEIDADEPALLDHRHVAEFARPSCAP